MVKLVLLTGSEGYIGTNLKKYLQDYKVICIDKKLGTNVQNLTQDDLKNVDCVIHLAANTNIAQLETDREAVHENLFSIAHLCKLISETCPETKLIFASSSAVHFSTSNYAMTKRFGEYPVMALSKNAVLRFYNVVGGIPDESNNDHILPNIFKSLVTDESFKVYGSLDLQRDYVYVGDLCEAIVKEIEYPLNRILELGTNKVFTIKEVIDKVEEITGRKVNVIIVNPRDGDIPLIQCEKPAYVLSEGLTRAIQDYKYDLIKKERYLDVSRLS